MGETLAGKDTKMATMDRMTKDGKKISGKAIETMHKALVEFGYTGIGIERVEGYVDNLIAGEKPVGGPDMFVQGWLKQAHLL